MKKRKEDFFSDLELIIAEGFFADCDRIAHEALIRQQRQERNRPKAIRVYNRMLKVIAYDAWAATERIEPDAFGDCYERIEMIKEIKTRQMRIAWALYCMFHWWGFNELAPGAKRYGKRYSAYRRLWYKYEAQIQEKARQARWDKKRKAVRARREGKKLDRRTRLNAEETLIRLKASRVQEAIDHLEPIQDLPKI